MAENIIIAVLALALIVLSVRHISIKRQMKKIDKQLSDESSRRRSLSIDLSDKSVESLALTINRLIEEHSQTVLDIEKDNRYLKNSIADISHDMRTPLTSTIGYLQLLLRSELDSEQSQNLKIALEKSQYLRELLSDFHNLSVLNTNDTVTILERVDLAGIVSESILSYANEFSQRDIAPISSQLDVPVFIMGNVEMLQRVMQNLVLNCLKYAKGDVVFSIVTDDSITLTIENPTDDMSKIDAERLFERFYKADSARSKQGTGLGLAITKLLVENMGGKISASVSEGTFTVRVGFPSPSGPIGLSSTNH
jgi:signal transduction histidine kinase